MVKTILFFVMSFLVTYFIGWLLYWFIPPLFSILQTPDIYLFRVLIFILGNIVGFLEAIIWFFVFD